MNYIVSERKVAFCGRYGHKNMLRFSGGLSPWDGFCATHNLTCAQIWALEIGEVLTTRYPGWECLVFGILWVPPTRLAVKNGCALEMGWVLYTRYVMKEDLALQIC